MEGQECVNDYKLGKQLGKGAYASVREARKGEGMRAERFAMKVFNKSALRKMKQWERNGRRMKITTGLDKMKVEIAIMKKVKHPNIVRCFEAIDDDDEDRMYLVLELCDRGQVMEYASGRYVRSNDDQATYSEDDVRHIIRHIADALEYLHRNNIAHRDIKPENVLLTRTRIAAPKNDREHPSSPQWATRLRPAGTPGPISLHNLRVKLTDLGVSLMGPEASIGTASGSLQDKAALKAGGTTTAAASQAANAYKTSEKPWHVTKRTEGTVHFFAPECCTGEEFSVLPVDLWSLGITMFCLLSGQLPFSGSTQSEVMDAIQNEEPDWKATGLAPDSEGMAVLRGLLNKLPSERMSIDELKRSAWLKPSDASMEEVDEEKQESKEALETELKVSEVDVDNALTPKLAVSTVMNLKIRLHKRRMLAAKRLLRQAWA